MLIRDAEIDGSRTDLRLAAGCIAAIGALTPMPGEPVFAARGGALLPGLHDHHIHLAALAARRSSVLCGPPEVRNAQDLAARLTTAPGTGWLRGILYHESVMGLPDARALDALLPDRPLRIQHRSGRMWLFNSAGLDALGATHPGLDRRTGHLFDADDWLRATLAGTPPDFDDVSRSLAACGITGITDMTPGNDAAMAAHFAGQSELRQRAILAGRLSLPGPGPAKLHLHEAALPDPDEAIAFVAAAHGQGRAVAVHCTSEVELVFALAALAAAPRGPRQDRIEHAGIAEDSHIAEIARLGLAVVSQPHFIAERGDQYLRDVEPRHHAVLYRLAAFHAAGVALAAGSDAPFGLPDPWASMRAAVSRRTRDGQMIGAAEALTPEQALDLWLADPDDLGRRRKIRVGAPADLCLLAHPWTEARERLSAGDVRANWIAGDLVHQAPA
jgi:predicted amidohydrolase YtcJ